VTARRRSLAGAGAGRGPVAVMIRSPRWRVRGLRPAETARRAARAALEAAPVPPGPAQGVTLVLSDDGELRELNRLWRGKDRPTNVLAFPSGPNWPGRDAALGEVILSFETLAREAEGAGRPLGHHLSHLVVHGVLHLLGYDHDRPAEARRMEGLEVKLLAGLGISDPYAAPAPSRRAARR
jgi:probable rRNA maturation factor